jgi:glycosyltransferase involved in cell wall biosynthesis
MNNSPLFSIVTSTHNRPFLLERMIDSVLKQTYKNWELIIIDDSTDNRTSKLMYRYQNNFKILYSRNKENIGLPESRNRGLDLATGDWIFFLDDDDLFFDNYSLQTVADCLTSNKISWAVFNRTDPSGCSFTKLLKPNKNQTYNWIKDFLFGRAIRGDAAHCLKKEMIDGIRYRGSHRAEWYFWYDLAKKSNFYYFDLNIIQAEYLPDGMSNTRYLENERIYQGQQFREMLKQPETLKYLPIITKRYFMSFVVVNKILNRLRNKQTSH